MFDLNTVHQHHLELIQEAQQARLARQSRRILRVRPHYAGLRWLGRQFTTIGVTLQARYTEPEPNIVATATVQQVQC